MGMRSSGGEATRSETIEGTKTTYQNGRAKLVIQNASQLAIVFVFVLPQRKPRLRAEREAQIEADSQRRAKDHFGHFRFNWKPNQGEQESGVQSSSARGRGQAAPATTSSSSCERRKIKVCQAGLH